MQALILAGGLGTRLRSIVSDKPKPLANIGGKPFLEYQIEFLKKHQIDHLVLCVGYLCEQVVEYFGDGSRWDVQIDYSIEEELLGTGGAVKHAEKYLQGTFLTLNGDSFFDLDLAAFIQFHARQKSEAKQECHLGTLALTQVQDARGYGSVRLGQANRIVDFSAKSTASNGSHLINAGIYVLEPAFLDFIPSSKRVSLEQETFPLVLEKGFHLLGYPANGFFVDIGTPTGYSVFRNHVL
ncbi:MAG: nucleotidyltransferase family protein [Chloroflexi bacterium]|nr:nucleotidyltransferase family protein [Chloroflexota bacterium]